MLTQVKTWGNSQGIRLPHEILKEAKIKSNDFLEIEVVNKKIVLKKEINIVHWLNVLQRQEER